MQPFDNYPYGGSRLLASYWKALKIDGSCRGPRGYGTSLMRLTGQQRRAYCAISFTDDLRHWLLMSLDHVVPITVGEALDIRREFIHDPLNFVLACSACNHGSNGYRPSPGHVPADDTLEAFAQFRDEIFVAKALDLAVRRQREEACFARQLWNEPLTITTD